MDKIITTKEFEKWLEGFIDYTRRKNQIRNDLSKIKFFAEYFNNPQNNYNSIHIAGSKGKGSVSTMIASILKEAKLKTGLYTSPHVMDFRERISSAGIFFSDDEYENTYKKIILGFENIIKENPNIDPGWFEIVTMTAFLLFREEKTEWAVFETGLGGRLDMTNILNPKASVLTPIELEHCAYLGNTIEKISNEKAGIIKQNTPVFCSKQNEQALSVFKIKAKKMNADFFYIPEIIKQINFNNSEYGLNLQVEFNSNNEIGKLFKRPLSTNLKLIDSVQAENATLAACVIKYLLPKLSQKIIEDGLSKAWLPARFEILSHNPKIIIDGAHTKNSIEICIRTFIEFTKNHTYFNKNQGILVFACAEDKNVKEFLYTFRYLFRKIIITIPTYEKASDINTVYDSFKTYFIKEKNDDKIKIEKDPNFDRAILNAVNESKKNQIPLLITGSFYLAAEAKKIIKKITNY